MSANEFDKKLFKRFAAHLPPNFTLPRNEIERILFAEYGALFVARSAVVVPKTVIFQNETGVSEFQSSVDISKARIGDFAVELQTPALEKLQRAIAEAEKNNLSATPRAVDSARRTYRETVELWASRVNPALEHWTKEGKLTKSEAEKIGSLPAQKQVAEVLKREKDGIFFSKDLKKSILYSVAPPGASQHLSLLALDINEYKDARVRQILAKHFWFQTVVSDLPHFTFLGAAESDLPALGLKKIETDGGRAFWIPNL